jgi:hypothetical protein
MGRNGVGSGNVEITAVGGIIKVIVGVCFASEGQHQTTDCWKLSSCLLK